MKILGIGVDIIDNKRIKDFVKRIFFVSNNFNIKETAKNKNTIFAPVKNKELQTIITRKNLWFFERSTNPNTPNAAINI